MLRSPTPTGRAPTPRHPIASGSVRVAGCLSLDEVARYVASTASDLDLEPLERHIDGCDACRRAVAALVRANRGDAPRPDGAPREGTQIGRYVVRGVRGTGAMGFVFDADDPGLDRRVAIKIIHYPGAEAG